MGIGSDRTAELGQARITIADAQIAEELVISAVLANDVDDVSDALMQRTHHPLIFCVFRYVQVIVGGNGAGQLRQIVGGGSRQGEEARLGQLQNVPVGPAAMHVPCRVVVVVAHHPALGPGTLLPFTM